MAFLECRDVRIAGMSACVPKRKVCNLDLQGISSDYDSAAFVESTGILERRVDDFTASDLCLAAAEKLMEDLGWAKKEIDALIFVSQTTDYYLPATACVLQDRLGLGRNCFAQDIVMGCSGWVYGLGTALSLLGGGQMKKALLLCGDARRHCDGDNPLFGYAGAATALEYCPGSKPFQFNYGTDGSGYDAIIIPDGGCRNQVNPESFAMEDIDGRPMNRLQTRMKGMDVFSFGISTAPKSVRALAEHFAFDYQSCDYFVFHQANRKLNDIVAGKLKLAPEKVLSSLRLFGNTSSASIPLSIVSNLSPGESGDLRLDGPLRFLCCGFGVGFSWGSVAFEAEDLLLSELVEL